MSSLETHYTASDIEARILAGLRAAGLNPQQHLSPEDLGALDHFHTGGLQASCDLLAMADIRPENRVLDIGAGLGGCARLLASRTGCHVDCVELSSDYCTGAVLLNRITGLDHQVKVHQGSALDLLFADETFDVVWMQNVGMNIADKLKLYSEVARVLKPDGRFVFQEVTAGNIAASYFPLPWATEPADSTLVTADEMCAILGTCGFVDDVFEDVSDAQFSTNVANSTPSSQGQLSLTVFVDNLGEKAGNARRSLEEGQIRYVRGVFRVN
jgi:SAM-dependent methyltransferase